jgi:hypothetical protein
LALAALQQGTVNYVGQKVTRNPWLYQNTKLYMLTILHGSEPSAPFHIIFVTIGAYLFLLYSQKHGKEHKQQQNSGGQCSNCLFVNSGQGL